MRFDGSDRHWVLAMLCLALAGCDGVVMGGPLDAGLVDGRALDAPSDPMRDASSLDASHDALVPADAASLVTGIAPHPGIEGEIDASDGELPVHVTPTSPALVRIEAAPNEHVTFFLTFTEGLRTIELEVLRWDGERAVSLGVTDAGPGLRTLAAFDPSGPRTFWARVTTELPSLDATLTITRVPFDDGPMCLEDCAHLLQMPLPNDPALDGYTTRSSTVFRYQYGRRDLLMYVRHAAQRVAGLGMAPLIPEDFSQWDGMTPGTDVGAPRHASHQRGKDVDISLHGLDGMNEWRSYCTPEATADGRECVPGTIMNFDGTANAIWFGDIFASGRVTMCFLDRELIPAAVTGAEEASLVGELDDTLVPLFDDGVHLQHWPNHDNHLHVRVSESDSIGALSWTGARTEEPFEAP
ncbi:MAG: hypothetical protein U0353_06840 [Sandaracinus sp.]